MKQYDTFTLLKDINPIIKKGIRGVILEIYNDTDIEVEFVKNNGENYEYQGKSTFTISKEWIE